jgi:chloride channel 2
MLRVPCCVSARIWLYKDLTTHPVVQYVAWISLPVFLILFSAGFVHIVAPQSIGNFATLILVAPS